MNPDNPSAFPCSGAEGVNPESLGMTLRDYFAAAVLPQLIPNYNYRFSPEKAAALAYEFADSMIKRRAVIPTEDEAIETCQADTLEHHHVHDR